MSQTTRNHVPIPAGSQPATGRDRAAVGAVGAEEGGDDRREHEDRLETLAEHEDRAVEHDRRVAQTVPGRQGRRVGGAALRMPAQITTVTAIASTIAVQR